MDIFNTKAYSDWVSEVSRPSQQTTGITKPVTSQGPITPAPATSVHSPASPHLGSGSPINKAGVELQQLQRRTNATSASAAAAPTGSPELNIPKLKTA